MLFAGVSLVVTADGRGEEAVALSASDCSSGIWTLSLGLFAFDWAVFDRDGGGNSTEFVLLGTGASLCDLDEDVSFEAWFRISDCVSFSRLISDLGSVVLLPIPQC